MADDDNNFADEMAKTGVKPLAKRQSKVILQTAQQDLNKPVLRRAATDLVQDNDPRHYQEVEWLGPHDIVEYKRQGIQHEVIKNLKRGHYDVGADLDLHSYRVEEAKVALFRFIKDCMEQDVRCAIIVHGKGWHTHSQADELDQDKSKTISKLKSYTVHWLKTMDVVQAFSSTQAKDGGTGALYVLFKKSEKAKERDRQHFRPDEK